VSVRARESRSRGHADAGKEAGSAELGFWPLAHPASCEPGAETDIADQDLRAGMPRPLCMPSQQLAISGRNTFVVRLPDKCGGGGLMIR
jgi:hypothetical protein